MNESKQRKHVLTTLQNATKIVELAKSEGMTDYDLRNAIELIYQMHEEKATAATAAENPSHVSLDTPMTPNQFEVMRGCNHSQQEPGNQPK